MRNLFMLAVMLCMLLSCTKQENPVDERIPINISVGQQTKANDSNFENDDEVGIYVVNYTDAYAGTLNDSGNHIDNAKFTYGSSGWTPDATIYWKDKKTSADFYAYYPYSETVTDVTAHPFSIKEDQSSEDDFWASDFLWGKTANVTPTSDAVSIVTNHVLSRMVINIKSIDGSSDNQEIESVTISGLKTAATIDLSTGTATATGEPKDIIPFKDKDGSYKAMVIPQEIAESSKLVTIRVGGVNYVYKKAISFNENTQHNFNISVSKTGINADITIGEWEIDNTDNNGVAEEEFDIPDNQIWYTSVDEKVINLSDESASADFRASIISNTYQNGKGIITLNKPITNIVSRAFSNCNNLETITLPEGITSIGWEAFSYCGRLKSINIPQSVTSLGQNPFLGCFDLQFTGKYATADGKCLIQDGSLISFCPGPDNPTSYIVPDNVTHIGGEAFGHCSNLTSIQLHSNITSIAMYAFTACFNLSSISLPQELYSIGDCAFSYCMSLTSINIPQSVTFLGENPFLGCLNLQFTGKYATADGKCLIQDGSLISFSPGTTDNISYSVPEGVNKIKDQAFRRCSNLTQITLHNNVASIGKFAFADCDGLQSFIIPNKVTTIEFGTFDHCTSLTSVNIPESVKSISTYAFYYCRSLSSITIPKSVESLGNSPFDWCTSLQHIYCYPLNPPSLENDIMQNSTIHKDLQIHVPQGSVDAYKTATNWSKYNDLIVGIVED